MSLAVRVGLIAAGVLLATLAALAWDSSRAISQELAAAYTSRSAAVARSLAIQLERLQQYGIALQDIEGFDEQLAEAVRSYEGLSHAYVVDAHGQVLFRHSAPGSPQDAHLNARAEVRRAGEITAVVVVGYRASLVSQRLAAAERRAAVAAAAVFLAGLLVLAAALRYFVQRPLRRLHRSIEQVSGPRGLAVRIPEAGPREFRALGSAFNGMLQALQQQAGELRRAKQDADGANHAKSMFLAKMSHEIRTPMHGVLGMLEMLGHTPLSPQQRRFTSAAERSGQALLGIINDVLDFTRIEVGRLQLECAPFRLGQVAEDCAAIVRPSAGARGVAVHVACAPEVPAWVQGDPLRVRQVMWNLVSNAAKFTVQGEVRIQLDVPAAGEVRIRVSDSGVGIDPALHARVFEPFRQADDSVARRFGGTGLGLAITRELVQAMHGRIVLASTPGQGTTFTVLLPLPSADAPPEATPAAADVPLPAHGGARRARVLLVDDNELNRELIEAMLEDQPVALTCAADGQSAVARLREGGIDLVLMDCSMPGMDGYAAARAMRAWEQSRGLARVPVIALTGNVAADAAQRCRDAGMDDYLAKPCPRAQLLEVLARWLPAAPPQPAAELDFSALEALRGLQKPGAPDLVARALELFREHATRLAAQARDAARSGEREVVERAGHTLASGCLNVGAIAASRLARELERGAAALAPDALMQLAARLETEALRAAGLLEARFGAKEAA